MPKEVIEFVANSEPTVRMKDFVEFLINNMSEAEQNEAVKVIISTLKEHRHDAMSAINNRKDELGNAIIGLDYILMGNKIVEKLTVTGNSRGSAYDSGKVDSKVTY